MLIPAGLTLIDGQPTSDADDEQYRRRVTKGHVPALRIQPVSSSRLQFTDRLSFAVARANNAGAQVIGVEITSFIRVADPNVAATAGYHGAALEGSSVVEHNSLHPVLREGSWNATNT